MKFLNKQLKECGHGSSRLVYSWGKNAVIKIPKHSNIQDQTQKQYKEYLIGINQTLTEINIYKKNKYKYLLCPIEEYGIYNNIFYCIYHKAIPANKILNTQDFDLEFFCKKMNLNYKYLHEDIYKLADKFNLDFYDLTENEDNFGFSKSLKKFVLIDYGYKSDFDYTNIHNLLNNNKALSKKIIGDTKWMNKM